METKSIIELLKNTSGVTYIAALDGDRHVLKVQIDLLKTHDDLVQIRSGGGVKSVDLLAASLKTTGNTSVYMPCVYIEGEMKDGKGVLRFFIADGHQRVRAAKQNGYTEIIIQWISRWKTVHDAMADALNLQYARYEATDADIISVMTTGLLAVAEVARLTGKSEATVRRFQTVCSEPEICNMIAEGCLTYTIAAKLIDATGGNNDKLNQLRSYLQTKYDAAKQQSDHWANKIKADKRLKNDKNAKERARLASYFKGEDWGVLEGAIEESVPGKQLDVTTTIKGAPPYVGDTAQWDEDGGKIAIFNAEGANASDLTADDFSNFIVQLEKEALPKLRALRDRKVLEESKAAIPMPSVNPILPPSQPKQPTKQKANLKVAPAE